MKKFVSFIILILALVAIGSFTVYTLLNPGIREEVETKIHKKIEKLTSNYSSNGVTEIYNIYLNNERHKLKVEYSKSVEAENLVILTLYFDGKVIFDYPVLEISNIDDLFHTEMFQTVSLSENNFKILSTDMDYLLIDVVFNVESFFEKYFVYNNNGDNLINEGLLVKDSSYNYGNKNDEQLELYRDEEGYQVLVKLENNDIFAFQKKEEKNKIILEEYKYKLEKNKLKKELINTYEDVVLIEMSD